MNVCRRCVRSHRRHAAGSALVSAACASAVLAIFIASLLGYVTSEYNIGRRSHQWSQALYLAEAGAEIGFAEFNYHYFKGGSGFQSSRGWTDLGGGLYSLTTNGLTDTAGRSLGDIKIIVAGVGTSSPYMYGIGTCYSSLFGGTNIVRAVKVTLVNSPRFPVGLMSRNDINMNGNNFYSDSYDSTDSTKSTSGRYDSSKKQSNGDVATNSGLTDSVNIGNADVYGRVYTGPEDTVTMGPNGSIGPTFIAADRADTVAEALANGWIRQDFSADVPGVSLPSGLSGASSLGNINNTTVISGGDWRASGISLSGTKTLTISGTVRLYVTGSVSVSGNGVVNDSTAPINNQWFGLSNSTSWSVSGNGEWIGTVYAPNADLSVSGNGVINGAVVANSLTLGGNAAFHYDESLESSGGNVGYRVASWQSGRWDAGVFVPD